MVHVYDIDLSRANDRRILEHARVNGRTIVTLDADFHALLAVDNANGPSVIRIRRQGLTGDKLAELLLQLWPAVVPTKNSVLFDAVDFSWPRALAFPG